MEAADEDLDPGMFESGADSVDWTIGGAAPSIGPSAARRRTI
jgi:hypothetical protein